VLSIDENEVNQEHYLWQAFYLGEDYQHWKFSLTERGTYVIRLQSAELYDEKWCMAAGNGIITSYGRNVKQMEYDENDGDYKDEWQLHFADTYAYITYPIRIFFDNNCEMTEEEIKEAFNDAKSIFLRKYHILFDLTSIEYNDTLNLNTLGCSSPGVDGICSEDCERESLCKMNHHKGGGRLLNLLNSDTIHTLRIVGYDLCNYDEKTHNHNLINGAAIGNNDTIVQTNFAKYQNGETINVTISQVSYVILHELAHNLGTDHDKCEKGFCTMEQNLNTNYWCSACDKAIRDNY
jgi:hypothetical protein